MLERRRADMTVSQDRRDRGGSERRVAPRYRAGGTTVLLTWADHDDYKTAGAELRDISLGGGSAFAGEAPAAGTVVWFRLRNDDTSPWIGATLIAVSRTGILGRGPRLVRWRFREACPYEVFKAAIDGFSFEVYVPDPRLPGSNRRDWR